MWAVAPALYYRQNTPREYRMLHHSPSLSRPRLLQSCVVAQIKQNCNARSAPYKGAGEVLVEDRNICIADKCGVWETAVS